jgi:hypothetical protein
VSRPDVFGSLPRAGTPRQPGAQRTGAGGVTARIGGAPLRAGHCTAQAAPGGVALLPHGAHLARGGGSRMRDRPEARRRPGAQRAAGDHWGLCEGVSGFDAELVLLGSSVLFGSFFGSFSSTSPFSNLAGFLSITVSRINSIRPHILRTTFRRTPVSAHSWGCWGWW